MCRVVYGLQMGEDVRRICGLSARVTMRPLWDVGW